MIRPQMVSREAASDSRKPIFFSELLQDASTGEKKRIMPRYLIWAYFIIYVIWTTTLRASFMKLMW